MTTTLAAARAALQNKIAAIVAANEGWPAVEINDPAIEEEPVSGDRLILGDAGVETAGTQMGNPVRYEIEADFTLAIVVIDQARATRDARLAAIRDGLIAALEADFTLGGAIDELEIGGTDPNWSGGEGVEISRDETIPLTLSFISLARGGAA